MACDSPKTAEAVATGPVAIFAEDVAQFKSAFIAFHRAAGTVSSEDRHSDPGARDLDCANPVSRVRFGRRARIRRRR